MSEQVDELKEMEKKKLDAAFDSYNGADKRMEVAETLPPEIETPRPRREGRGNPNLGVLLVVAGIILFLMFSGFAVRFGFWGWMIMGWLVLAAFKKKGRGCSW